MNIGKFSKYVPCVIEFHLLSLFGCQIRRNSAVVFLWIRDSCPICNEKF